MILAFHGEPLLKQAVMDRLYEHRRLDQIIQGTYWEQGRGCHLGCITHAEENWHAEAERLFGIEQCIGYWLEAVFEGLPKDECTRWVMESTESIPCGADMSKCHHHFLSWLMLDSGLLAVTATNRDVIETAGNLHRRSITGEVAESEWSAAVAEAELAAESAAALAAAAWAEAASESAEAAWAEAELAAESAAALAAAARAAAWARAARAAALAAALAAAWAAAARAAVWRKIAAKSIEIFAAAPVAAGAIEPAIERELCCRNLWCREGALVA